MIGPKVRVVLNEDGSGEVWMNDEKLPGVLAVQVTGAAREQPRVVVTVIPGTLTADLPETGVQLVTHVQGSASEFIASVNPRALEQKVVDDGDMGTSFGEGFVGVLSQMAAEFDALRR